jgi:hypothetical protein
MESDFNLAQSAMSGNRRKIFHFLNFRELVAARPTTRRCDGSVNGAVEMMFRNLRQVLAAVTRKDHTTVSMRIGLTRHGSLLRSASFQHPVFG